MTSLALCLWLMGIGQMNRNFAPAFEIPDNGELHRITWQDESTQENAPKGFRVYIARYGEPWDLLGQVQSHKTYLDFDAEAIAHGMVYIVVTAFNDAGELPTEHGPYPGWGLEEP